LDTDKRTSRDWDGFFFGVWCLVMLSIYGLLIYALTIA
jgi:hypothetical protein